MRTTCKVPNNTEEVSDSVMGPSHLMARCGSRLHGACHRELQSVQTLRVACDCDAVRILVVETHTSRSIVLGRGWLCWVEVGCARLWGFLVQIGLEPLNAI